MKNLFTISVIILMAGSMLFPGLVFAQSPDKISYQAVVRDAEGNLVAGRQVGLQIRILQGSADGNAVYIQTLTTETNANGLVSVDIGGEAGFTEIDWSAGPYFIETGTDPSGGTDYTITGTSQLLSVPFALHAKTAETIAGPIAEEDPVFAASPASGIEAADIGNWDEAYFWGDHSGEGYLTVETDPLFTSTFDIADPEEGDLLRYNATTGTWERFTPAFAPDVHDHDVATTETDGFMSAGDKARLDGIEDGAQVNVQPDWEATSGDAQILNKPATISDFSLDAGSGNITNLADPVNGQDAVTKSYVALRVSTTGDTLFLGNDQYVVIPGLTFANPYFAAGEPVTDNAGNEYTTVIIGQQTWMAENLKTTNYNNGDPIHYPGDHEHEPYWADCNAGETGAFAWYENDDSYKNMYGALYNWYAVADSRGICPAGWRVPRRGDWEELREYVGGTNIMGERLKSTRTEPDPHPRWDSPNVANNETGFSAFPGGQRNSDGSFDWLGGQGFWWTSTEYFRLRTLYYDGGMFDFSSDETRSGYSVRCIEAAVD